MKALSVERRPHSRTRSEMEGSPRQQGDDDSRRAKRIRSENNLPEDVLHHVHALMPMRDAARAACVSRAFLRSWRRYPKLIFDTEALGVKDSTEEEFISEAITNRLDQRRRDFASRVDHIMRNHSGTGVKTFRLGTYPHGSLHPSFIDLLLQAVITPGIEEFQLLMPCGRNEYSFPCSLLSTDRGSAIRSFFLANCAFHPAKLDVGRLSSLTSLRLSSVAITGEELCCFLSNSFALELLNLSDCYSIASLKIPHELSRLSSLQLFNCEVLEMLESSAPNLSFFDYVGSPIRISLGGSAKLRKMQISSSSYRADMVCYASADLASMAPNLQTLFLSPRDETINTPMVIGKFIHLRYLNIVLDPHRSPGYDFYSLVRFLDAFPALETFIMRVEQPATMHDSILEYSDSNSFHLRRLSEFRHDSLKNVTIAGFCSAKSMIELTIHIIENAASLECLTLDTTLGNDMRFRKVDECLQMSKEALLAIGRYIEGKCPQLLT